MTNAPLTRKTHVIRILGTNRAGERLTDVWIDVERIDRMKGVFAGDTEQWTGQQRKFRWCDDPDSDEYHPEGNPSRRTKTVKVCDPQTENVDDPDEWVPLEVIESMKSVSSNSNFQGTVERPLSEAAVQTRKTETRRIVHYDTNIDDVAEAAFADASRTVYVVPGEDYVRDDGTKDEDQYVEHEIILRGKFRGNVTRHYDAVDPLGTEGYQGRQIKMLNQYLIDESEPAENDVIGAEGINPPYRLDPYQNIVNVQFAPRVYVIISGAINFAHLTSDSNSSVKILETRSETLPGADFPITGTLIECSANSGDNFAEMFVTPLGPGVFEHIIVSGFACPKTSEVRANWFDWYVKNLETVGSNPNDIRGPFLFYFLTDFGSSARMSLKIRRVSHLIDPGPGQTDHMVQLYPMTGTNVLRRGWFTIGYRLDKSGTGQIFSQPPEWTTDTVYSVVDEPVRGLFFGKNPPLIAADIPYIP